MALVVVAWVAILELFACHKQSSDDGDDDAGDADGPCTCPLTEGPIVEQVACGATVCVGGTFYLCSSGDTIAEGLCGDSGSGEQYDGGDGGGSGCVPECTGVSCGGPDMCGSICGCAQGVDCVGGMCGNGCGLLAGSICSEDGGTSDPQTCCQQGNLCRVTDSGVPVCCAQTTTASSLGGLCSTSTECCGYPAVTCVLEGGLGTCVF
jgi:hypothetical protein